MESKNQQTDETTKNTSSQSSQHNLVFELSAEDYQVIMNSLAEVPAKIVYRTMILMEGQYLRQVNK